MPTPRIILDCDPGHDDAVALLLAAHTCDLLGVTTVSGNAPLHLTTHNALIRARRFTGSMCPSTRARIARSSPRRSTPRLSTARRGWAGRSCRT